jgi:hypothetical protein
VAEGAGPEFSPSTTKKKKERNRKQISGYRGGGWGVVGEGSRREGRVWLLKILVIELFCFLNVSRSLSWLYFNVQAVTIEGN